MLIIFWLVWTVQADNCLLKSPQHAKCTQTIANLTLPANVTTLELDDIQEPALDLRPLLYQFPKLVNLSIYDGTMHRIIAPQANNAIKLVRVGVIDLAGDFFTKFPMLHSLNLEGNFLQTLHGLNVPTLKKLKIADNKWNCSLDLDWVLQFRDLIKDLENLTCVGQPHQNKNLLAIARFKQALKKDCPGNCSCTLPKVIHPKLNSQHLEPIIEVNCSYRGFTQLPLDLPEKTRIIHLEGNNIRDLHPLKKHSVYSGMFDLYLDSNQIKTIDELEGSYFLRNFRVFSLADNKLSELPTYAIDNALVTNPHMPDAVRLFLGGNPWRCDCVFTPVFQEMLQKFAPQIQDVRQVRCSVVEGDDNSQRPIIGLSRSSVCRSQNESAVQALDLLNAVLASLILLILGKLAYDYYNFKRTGRLPWIVTKMP